MTWLTAVAGVAVAARTSLVGLRTYRNSVAIKRMESLTQLHRSFFVDINCKKVRQQLDDDSEGGPASRKALVAEPERESDLVDFLNSFELVAYIAKLEGYKKDDVEAVLGYYLRLLKQPGPVYDYICEKKYSFENLKAFLVD